MMDLSQIESPPMARSSTTDDDNSSFESDSHESSDGEVEITKKKDDFNIEELTLRETKGVRYSRSCFVVFVSLDDLRGCAFR